MESTAEGHWKSLPNQARAFLLETPLESLDVHEFANFWSSPMVAEHVRSPGLARNARDASFFMGLVDYLLKGKVKEAWALVLNGFFILECMNSGIESIAQWCRENVNAPCPPELKHFRDAFCSEKTPQALQTLLERTVAVKLQTSPTEVVKFSGKTLNAREVIDCCDFTERDQKPSSETSPGSQIQLIIVDDANREERPALNIGSSTTLKTLFNEYAEKRGVSLRSLRFSFAGKILFLSSVGNKTPDQLNMKDQDVITVCNTTNTSRETSSGKATKKQRAKPKQNTKKHNNSRKKTKGKCKKDHSKSKEASRTIEDCKAQHSSTLSKLHQEAQPRLKQIRMRLNALDLERQPPKEKRKNKRGKRGKENAECATSLSNSGVGGKAGKPYFVVSAGEVRNLYKSTKSGRRSPRKSDTLDLHGCTRDEALARLDESLAAWVDTAMRGSYPFVIPAKIVCGCGNQILSETVEAWIRDRAQVANCPDGFL